MQNPNEDPTNIYEYEMKAHTKPVQHHYPSKSLKNIHRSSSHYKSYKYADIGFTITKQNKKYVAHCRVCNRTLGNTAYARLKGHRNICREAPLEDNGSECPLYPVDNNETYVTKQNDSLSQHCVSQTSNDSSRLTFNVVTPKIEAAECQNSANLHSYNNFDQETQLLNEENQLKLNMIEVLLPIKYNKRLLFEDNTKKSVDIWMKVLTKAQSLGLAPTGVPWNYARDSLYSVWRLHTLQKKDAIESGQTNVKYNIVDLSILQIENAPMSNENSSFENENLYETANNSMGDRTSTENTLTSKNNCTLDSTATIATQTSDEMYKADLRLKLLQCESMEIGMKTPNSSFEICCQVFPYYANSFK